MVGSTQDFLLAYDASCGPCSRFKAIVEFLDAKRRIGFVSLDMADRSGVIEGISPSLRYRSFHLVRSPVSPVKGEGIRSGSDALLPLLRLLIPGGTIASRIVEATPGANGAISFAYSVFSRVHDAGSCEPKARPDRAGPEGS
jgi:predicted DCC family thiol-disulfide oxidoreductase YuxK